MLDNQEKVEVPDIQETETKKTYEELVAELAKANAEKERLKTSLDRTSSEVADYKKKYREKLNAEEQAAEKQKEKDEYVKGLEKKIQTNEAFKRYTSLGMDADLAMQTAQFDIDGDTDSVTANIKTFQQALLENEKAKWLKSRPEVNHGHGESQSKEDDDPFLKGFNKR